MDFHAGLIIGRSAEDLALGSRDGGNYAGLKVSPHHPLFFDTQCQRSYIQQQNILHIPLQNTTLDGRTD
jgi:hypothetical protein